MLSAQARKMKHVLHFAKNGLFYVTPNGVQRPNNNLSKHKARQQTHATKAKEVVLPKHHCFSAADVLLTLIRRGKQSDYTSPLKHTLLMIIQWQLDMHVIHNSLIISHNGVMIRERNIIIANKAWASGPPAQSVACHQLDWRIRQIGEYRAINSAVYLCTALMAHLSAPGSHLTGVSLSNEELSTRPAWNFTPEAGHIS